MHLHDTPPLDELTLAQNLDDAVELARRQPGAAITLWRLPEQFVADQIRLRGIPDSNVVIGQDPQEPLPRLFALIPEVGTARTLVCISAVPGPMAKAIAAERNQRIVDLEAA